MTDMPADSTRGDDAGLAPAVYAAVAARRAQFDNLLWQVPAVSLTAQAFLFTIALDSGSRRLARAVACLLSLVATFLTVQILTRHRQAEITDAHWLAEFESANGLSPQAHGPDWRRRRNATPADAWVFSPLARLPGFKTWALGLSIFGVAALVILIITVAAPQLLEAR
ncbi:MAG: hypothetical protein ACJ74O_06560 [Frankiaceae bacterium]